MKKLTCFFGLWVLLAFAVSAQVGINTDGSQPDNSAQLDVKSTTKGFLPPRMTTTQRDAIISPARGLVVYNLDCDDFQYFNGATWIPLGNSGNVAAPLTISGLTTPCINAVGVTYSIAPIPGAVGYTWTAPIGSIITAGQGTTTITVSFGSTDGAIFVSAYGTCWKSIGAYLGIQLQPLPATPVEGVHVPLQTQITWNWNAVQGATGYKFSSVNDYSTAQDMGTATTKTETGLVCDNAYTRYVWAYNNCGTSSPTTLTQTTTVCSLWSCGQPFTDSRDSKTYSTVLIDTQCWMAQNLNIGTRINGSQDQTNNQMIEKYCYNDLESNCDIYGGLYQWDEAMQYVTTAGVQGICPAGWHLPTDAEWSTLTTFLGGVSVAGGKMKETGTTHWASPNTGATNSSGLTALPGGHRNSIGSFNDLTYYAFFWSSSQYDATTAWGRLLYHNYADVYRNDYNITYGLSGRCLKDSGSSTTTPTVSTTSVSNVTQTSAQSGGNVTSDGCATVTARGVCWSTSPNPTVSDNYTTDGGGTGTFVSAISGLSPNTPYYVRAYATNSVGTSYGNEVSFTTLAAFACGSSITVNHLAGNVAPVDKTTTYGTVTNIPGEPNKCWITSNLGSDHQATAVNDATEASAGWYWQFNRKQGFKHDGTTRTPNTTWVTTINENFDWIIANDPCNIELGGTWRIPTHTEWSNVDNSGGWTNWYGPWNSLLKLHAAGNLDDADGSLNYRGSEGYYFSSKQSAVDISNIFYFYDGSSMTDLYPKGRALSIRCLKD